MKEIVLVKEEVASVHLVTSPAGRKKQNGARQLKNNKKGMAPDYEA